MKFLKNNLKLIIGFIVGVILATSITVYAYSYIASDVKYIKSEGATKKEISVEQALNELYANQNKLESLQLYNKTSILTSSGTTPSTENIQLEPGKYIFVAAGRTSEYNSVISVSKENSTEIHKIGDTQNFNKLVGTGTVNDFKAGRGSAIIELYEANFIGNSTITFSIAGTNSNYNATGILIVYKFDI